MANVVEIIIKAVDQTKAGLNTPINSMGALSTAVGKLGPAFYTLAATATTAYLTMAKSFVNTADELNDMSAKLGIAVEDLSAYKYIAEMSGTSLEEFAKSMKKLSMNMVEASRGGKDAQLAFRALSVEYKNNDGTLRNTNDVLLDMADKFSRMEDGPMKTALAMKAFGKSGADLIPILNEGRDSIKEMMEENRQFGTEIDSRTAKAADDLNDSMTKIGYAFKGIVYQSMKDFLPVLREFALALVDSAKKGGFVYNVFNALGQVISVVGKIVFTAFAIIIEQVKRIGQIIGDVLAVAFQVITGDIRGAFQTAYDSFKDFEQQDKDFAERLKNIWTAKAPEIKEKKKDIFITDEDLVSQKEKQALAVQQAKEFLDGLSTEVKSYMDYFEQVQQQARMGLLSFIQSMSQTFTTAFVTSMQNMVNQTNSAKERWVELRKAMVNAIVEYMAKRVVSFALERALSAASIAILGAQTVAAITAARAIAAGWSSAAAMVSLATFGTNAPPAIAGMASAVTAARGMAAFETGTDFVPNTGIAMVHKGEGVLDTDRNERLTEFLDSQTSRPNVANLMLDRRVLGQVILDLVRSGDLPLEVKA